MSPEIRALLEEMRSVPGSISGLAAAGAAGRALDEIDRLREVLESIARNKYGLQGIDEDYGHDANAYNYHAMKYWEMLATSYQNAARSALSTPTPAEPRTTRADSAWRNG